MGVLLAPVLEETIFRGYIYPVVARSFGINAGILVTGTLFGLLHASQLWGGWVTDRAASPRRDRLHLRARQDAHRARQLLAAC